MTNEYKIRCTLDEPIYRLMEKLSSKSSDLYIFWQNYNQMYNMYNDRVLQIETLRQQIEILKRERNNFQKNYGPSESEYNILKQKVWTLQKYNIDFKNDNEKLKKQNEELLLINERLSEQNRHFQNLINQFRDENFIQKQNIDNILQRLRQTEFSMQLNTQNKASLEELSQINKKLKLTQDEYRKNINEKDQEIHSLTITIQQLKLNFEKLLTQSMRNAKNKVIESLPNLIQQSKTVKQIKYSSNSFHNN